jgi:hypothetical protein
LGSPRDDSRYREMENVEAHPMVPSARWGTQWSGGAMEELTGPGMGFLLCWFWLADEERKGEREAWRGK